MERIDTPLKDAFYLIPPQFEDVRGLFSETYNAQTFHRVTGLEVNFVQDNQSISKYGVLRGLHYQSGAHAQAKLVRVSAGKVLDVIVDLRKDSPTFGQHFSIELSAENRVQLFVPKGFAHGFITLSPEATFCYKCDAFYNKEAEGGILYNDATLAIDWHLKHDDVLVSDKDQILPTFLDATT